MKPAEQAASNAIVNASTAADKDGKLKAMADKAEVAMAKNKQWSGCL